MHLRPMLALWLAGALLGAPPLLWADSPPPADSKTPDAKTPDAKTPDAKSPVATESKAEADIEEALCPVTGRKVDFNISMQYRGKLVYFADAAALEKFRSDPDPHLDGVKAQWKALRPRRVQVLCPVTGKPCDEQFSLPLGHGTVRFATRAALEQWQTDSKPFEARLEECYTFQSHCLVCGHEIMPDLFVEVKGRKLYTACGGCVEVIEGNPERYLKKADEMIAANRAAWEKTHGRKN